MATRLPRGIIATSYEHAAQEYLRNLPLEHFMEATAQARQREITLESLALVKAQRPDVHVFNELLVQYPLSTQRKPGQVVPDNMVVISEQPIEAETSYNLPLEPAAPFWVLEYVSKKSRRKDYEDSFDKYERDLKVPYYLTFYPDNQELTLYRHTGAEYITVKPNGDGRYPIQELSLEMALLDGWVRYWWKGVLLPLPGELQTALEESLRRAEDIERRLQAEQEARRAAETELAQLRVALERRQAGRGDGS